MNAWKQFQDELQKKATGMVVGAIHKGRERISYRFELSEQDLQDKLEQFMPLDRVKYGIQLQLSDPLIRLHGHSGQVSLHLKIRAEAPMRVRLSGVISFRGKVVYQPEQQAFFIKGLIIDGLHLVEAPPRLVKHIRTLAQIIAGSLLARMPVYRLDGDKSSHRWARFALRSMQVRENKLVIHMGWGPALKTDKNLPPNGHKT